MPDKRTALYDNYVDLFFSRESEKSAIVREHRDLLKDIHCYLAWILHGEAERAGGRGSITEERLKQVVAEFLDSQGHDTTLVDELFTGVIERVVALVSRIEGTFEFEIQPLREYFAARHLYDTAPYAPVGDDTKGTRPERFDAVARNFYWTNVARFYCGCYNRGELPSLVDGLEELVEDPEYRYTNHPHVLAATLLADWVFAQLPRSQKRVVEMVLTPMGLRHMLNETALGRFRSEPIVLPKRCGGEALLQKALELLELSGASDETHSLIRLIVKNGNSVELADAWRKVDIAEGMTSERYLELAFHLEVLQHLSNGELEEICKAGKNLRRMCRTLLRGRKFDFIAKEAKLVEASLDVVLDGGSVAPIRNRGHIFELTWMLTSVHCYTSLLGVNDWGGESVRHALAEFVRRDENKTEAESGALGEVGPQLAKFVHAGAELFVRSGSEANEVLDAFRHLIDVGLEEFGQRWAFSNLVVFFAGSKARGKTDNEVYELFDESASLADRALGARRRAGNSAWWKRQLDGINSEEQRYFVALCIIVWGGPTVIAKCEKELTELIGLMDAKMQGSLVLAAREMLADAGFGRERLIKSKHGLSTKQWTGAAAASICLRASDSVREEIIMENGRGIFDHGTVVGSVLLNVALECWRGGDKDVWARKLKLIEEGRCQGITAHRWLAPSRREHVASDMSEEVAMKIIEEAERYPSALVAIAEDVCRRRVVKSIQPVLQRAQADGWG